MSFATQCPHCDARVRVPDEDDGERITCKKCRGTFRARRMDDEDEDERPTRRSRGGRGDDEGDDRRGRRRREDDDEPRPRRKAKKSGPPVVLFVILGVGALVVVGGAVGAVVYFSGGKKGAGNVRGGPDAAPDVGVWVEHVDAESKFRVKFPARPDVRQHQIQTAKGQVTRKDAVYRISAMPGDLTVGRGRGREFLAVAAPLPAGSDPQQVLQREFDNVPGPGLSIGTINERKPATHHGRPGREFRMMAVNPDDAVVRMFVANDRIYVLAVTGLGVRPDSPDVVAFFQSLVFD